MTKCRLFGNMDDAAWAILKPVKAVSDTRNNGERCLLVNEEKQADISSDSADSSTSK